MVLLGCMKGERIVITDKCTDKSCEYNEMASKSSASAMSHAESASASNKKANEFAVAA